MTIKTADRVISYIQPNGRGSALEPMSIQRHGLGDQTDNTIPGRGVLWGRDDFGRPTSKVEYDEPPSGLNTATVSFDPEADLDFLDTMRLENGLFGIWKFFIPVGRLSSYANWTNNGDLEYLAGCKIQAGTKGGRGKDYEGTPLTNTYDLAWRKTIHLLPPKLSAISPGSGVIAQDINDVAFISDLDPQFEIPGYPGRDKVGFAAGGASGTAAAVVAYTVTGGSSWAALGSSPFAAAEDIKALEVRFVAHDTYRVVALRETADAAAAAELAYTDIVLGGEGGSITWTTADIGATNNDAGEAMLWPLYGRLYTSVGGGNIYVSTNNGAAHTLVAAAGAVINKFAMDWEDGVWAVGASNVILREKSSNRGTFDALVGPSGGGAFHSIAIARDNLLFAGNGQYLYRSSNLAGTTGGWTQLYDFGANHTVVDLQCIDGESQLLRALVTDGTGNEGDVWYSLDGGNTWTEVTNVTNTGYSAWYPSPVDPNLVFIAGAASGGAGIVHKLSY